MWAAALEAAGIPLQLADEKDGTVPNPQDVRFAIAWNPPPGYLLQACSFPREACVCAYENNMLLAEFHSASCPYSFLCLKPYSLLVQE